MRPHHTNIPVIQAGREITMPTTSLKVLQT
jgi:hypothetical protein